MPSGKGRFFILNLIYEAILPDYHGRFALYMLSEGNGPVHASYIIL
jgi:hypothetical protein